MSNCIIVKRADPSAGLINPKEGKRGYRRSWYAKCPDCHKFVKGGVSSYHLNYSGTNSRKTAKDALYRHILLNHS